jgi:hypothetical protein
MDNRQSLPPTCPQPFRCAPAVAALGVWLLLPLSAGSWQAGGGGRPPDKAHKKAPHPHADNAFFCMKVAAAAQVAAIGNPFTVVAMRLRMKFWDEPVPAEAPPLDAAWLRSVRDEKPFLDMRARAPEDLKSPALREGHEEYLAYCQAILFASWVPADAFAKSAAESSLTFGHLYREPRRHRGKVVHMEGRLKRVVKQDPPPSAEKQGVKAVYEAYVYLDNREGAPPVIVLFPDLPPTLHVGDYEEAPKVAFDAYFFKKHRWVSGKWGPKGEREVVTSLMFIGPTLNVKEAPRRESRSSMPIPAPVLYGSIGFVGLAVVVLFAVNLWYRQGDRRVHARIRELQAQRFSDEVLAGEPPPGLGEGDGQAPPGGGSPPEAQGGKPNGPPPEAPRGGAPL